MKIPIFINSVDTRKVNNINMGFSHAQLSRVLYALTIIILILSSLHRNKCEFTLKNLKQKKT